MGFNSAFKGLSQRKIPMIPSEIEPATFRLAAHASTDCATTWPVAFLILIYFSWPWACVWVKIICNISTQTRSMLCLALDKKGSRGQQCRGQLKCDGTRAESRFCLRRNRRVYLNRLGRQFSRLLAAELCASAVVMLDTPCSEVVWRVLATHSIRQFSLHFPSRASPCTITFQLASTAFYVPFLHAAAGYHGYKVVTWCTGDI